MDYLIASLVYVALVVLEINGILWVRRKTRQNIEGYYIESDRVKD